jgi:misacylated tRNA(Ala) deacylase
LVGQSTRRLYLYDDDCFETEATLVAVRPGALAFDRTCFYPGGGGQPPDRGVVAIQNGITMNVDGVEIGAGGVLWHVVTGVPDTFTTGQLVQLAIDRSRRLALTRYHTVLHVLNTIALRDYHAWITGVQINEDYSRIDFKWEGFGAELVPELTTKVQAVLDGGHKIRAYYLDESDFRNRPDLLRTLDVKPPVIDGQVRIVEIVGFDAQACGGTHAATTADVGLFSIYRTENKGKNNKRLYVRLGSSAMPEPLEAVI